MTTFQASVPSIKGYKFTENAFLPKYVNIPLSQEKGCICKPLVNPGDVVEEGDVIAKAQGSAFKSDLHSPIPGKVVEIVSALCPNGTIEKAIRIKLEGKFTYLGKPLKTKNWKDLSPETIISRIGNAGITNTFKCSNPVSLEEQIRKKLSNPKRYVIVRLFDEDQFRIADTLMTKFKFDEIKEGALITAKAMDAEAVIFAIDSRFGLKDITENPGEKIYFVEMNSAKYPCGYKREIKNAFNKSLKKSTGINLTSKDFYTDPMTMVAVYKAINFGIPSINQYVHFSGNCLYSSCFLNVEMGFSIGDIVKQLGGFAKEPNLIIINGQICGSALTAMDVPVTKYVKSVEFISRPRNTDYHVYSCIKCGECRYICPVKLSPDLLYNYMVNNRKISENHKNSAVLCRDCGLCNTVCQARLPLGQTVTVLKNKLLSESQNNGK